jgi:hypothetical protein
MSLNLTTILAAVREVGAATPAFKALFDGVVTLFSPQDQDILKKSYQDACAKSDALNNELDDALGTASKR